MKAFHAPGWHGVRCGAVYVAVKDDARHRPLFSERNHIKCRTFRLGGTWRLLVRWGRACAPS